MVIWVSLVLRVMVAAALLRHEGDGQGRGGVLRGFGRGGFGFRGAFGVFPVHPAFGFAHAFFEFGSQHVGDAAPVFGVFVETVFELVQRGRVFVAAGAGEFGHVAGLFDQAQEVFGADGFFVCGHDG